MENMPPRIERFAEVRILHLRPIFRAHLSILGGVFSITSLLYEKKESLQRPNYLNSLFCEAFFLTQNSCGLAVVLSIKIAIFHLMTAAMLETQSK